MIITSRIREGQKPRDEQHSVIREVRQESESQEPKDKRTLNDQGKEVKNQCVVKSQGETSTLGREE